MHHNRNNEGSKIILFNIQNINYTEIIHSKKPNLKSIETNLCIKKLYLDNFHTKPFYLWTQICS